MLIFCSYSTGLFFLFHWPNAIRFCCCHKASVASEWWRDPWLMTWCGSPPPPPPAGDEAGEGLPHMLTEPAPSTSHPSTSPILLVPGDLAPPSSSFHLSIERRRAFMKKLPTVVGSRPSCLAIVTCISFDGLLVSCTSSNEISYNLRTTIGFWYFEGIVPWKWPAACAVAGRWRRGGASLATAAPAEAVAPPCVCIRPLLRTRDELD